MKIICLLSLILICCSCSTGHKNEGVNEAASLPAGFDFEKLGLRVITSSINHNNSTMSTLYANETALRELNNKTYSAFGDRILVLVTWKQKDDPYWYGAKIPGYLKSMELVKTDRSFSDTPNISYQYFEEKNRLSDTSNNRERINRILHMRPSEMP